MTNWQLGTDYDYVVAGVVILDIQGDIIGHLRDGNTPNSPNLVSFFGGHLEPDDVSPKEAALRELHEETNIRLTLADLTPLPSYIATVNTGKRELIYLFTGHHPNTEGLEVYEGQGYHLIQSAHDPLIAPVVQPVVDQLFAKKALDASHREA